MSTSSIPIYSEIIINKLDEQDFEHHNRARKVDSRLLKRKHVGLSFKVIENKKKLTII